jgi:large subunit ribosomal protein L22
MKAFIANYRQSPRKVRLVSNLIKGKSVERALNELKFVNKEASNVVTKLINSAISNAKQNDSKDASDLFVKELRVDDGPILKRMMPRARGSAYLIRKRTSHIALELGTKAPKKSDKKESAEAKSEEKLKKAKTTKATK